MAVDFVTRPPYNVVQPGAYSAVSVSELTSPSALAGQPIPAILGTAKGGKPNEPLYFQSPGQLLAALRSGIGYDGCRFALGAGPPQIAFVRVGNSITQGTLEMEAVTSGKAIKVTSLDYGTWVNAITMTVTAGPIVTLKYTDELGNVYKEIWNLTEVESGSPTNAKIAEAINGKLYGFTSSNFITAEAGVGTGGLKVVSATNLAGGTDGSAPASGDWTKGLEALENVQVSIVVPMTGEATIHAQVQEHCQVMSNPNTRHERTCVVGGVKGETAAQQITRMASLRSARTQLVYPGMEQYNSKGELSIYDPFYRAAMVAGMHCALPDVATSLTHALTPEVGVETPLSTVQGGPVDQLLLAGVTPFVRAPRSGVWCVDSLSGNNEPSGVFRDFHKTRSADYVARYLRYALETKYVGGKSLNGTRESIQIQTSILLKELLANQIIRAFNEPTVELGPPNSPIVTSGNSYNVTAPVMLVDTDKYIFITVALQSPTTIQTGA
jgi:Phage tail sheath protein subtilisin-like domain